MGNIGAVILAAGGSSRLGQPKQLLKFQGETLIRRAVRSAAEAGCAPILVVAGEIATAIRRELEATSAIVVENPQWQRGLGTSIRAGIKQMGTGIEAALLMTTDQPMVSASILLELIAAREKTGKPIVASRYADTLGVPALFDRSCFPALKSLPDDSGAKSLIVTENAEAVSFNAGAIDVDTPEDFERLQRNHG